MSWFPRGRVIHPARSRVIPARSLISGDPGEISDLSALGEIRGAHGRWHAVRDVKCRTYMRTGTRHEYSV